MLIPSAAMGAFDAAGDIATGSLIGRAAEPYAGEAVAAEHPAICMNCGTTLAGGFCHACGQRGHVHRSLHEIGHELLHGVFHFEGRIWRTLPMLALRPGELTRRYVHGERARFVSPLALFLFTVFLLFASISTIGGEIGEGETLSPKEATRIDGQIAKIDGEMTRITAARATAKRAGRPVTDLDERRAALRITRRGLELAATGQGGSAATFTDVKTGWARLDKGIAKANANPGLALYKIQSSAYKYSWALIPLSVPFVALLFLWRSGHALYDHAVFVTYSIAFMMLLVVALTLLGAIGVAGGWLALAVLAIPPVHMFAQLRGAYRLRRRSALWRTISLLAFAFAVLLAFAALLLLHGLTE